MEMPNDSSHPITISTASSPINHEQRAWLIRPILLPHPTPARRKGPTGGSGLLPRLSMRQLIAVPAAQLDFCPDKPFVHVEHVNVCIGEGTIQLGVVHFEGGLARELVQLPRRDDG